MIVNQIFICIFAFRFEDNNKYRCMESLVFVKDEQEEKWVSTLVAPDGGCVVQVDRGGDALLMVYANLEGMNPVSVFGVPAHGRTDVIFELNIPAGVNVTIVSWSEVVNAQMYTSDEA